jgi:bifunctional pyridoxal-dependent enzyme with beta-cystathionase and maltose regulon repressor activities
MSDNNDKQNLHQLALKVADLAARPIENEKRKMWYEHNALKATRPLIFCDPENGWGEIITSESLQCKSELARQWEFRLL